MHAPQTLQELVHALHDAGDRPGLLALQRDGLTCWSYARLSDEVQQLACGLHRAGIGSGDYVALLARNAPEWVLACLAIISAGAAVVPIDSQIRTETLGQVLRDSQARMLFTTHDYLERIASLNLDPQPRLILLDAEPSDERDWRALQTRAAIALPQVGPDDPAALFYTSGTTGIPKGVPLTQANLAFQMRSIVATGLVQAHDRVLTPLPLYHVYPFTTGLFAPLAFRVPLVLPQSIAGPHIVRAIQQGQASLIIGVPRLYRALYDRIEGRIVGRGKLAARLFPALLRLSIAARRRFNLKLGDVLFGPIRRQIGPHLRVLTSGGSSLDPDLAGKLEGLGWRVVIGYGLTETSPLLTVNLMGRHIPRLASVGVPMPGIELRLDTAAPVEGQDPAETHLAPGEGEILARGPGVFRGYRNLPDQTARVLTDDGWFRTGDLGYQDDEGYIYITGRASTLIVTEGGKNIQPEAIENVYQQHRLISEIGILQQNNRLVGLIVPNHEALDAQADDAVEQAIRASLTECNQNLPSYQRIVDFTLTDEPLPRTNLGKIRRHLLAEHYRRTRETVA